MDTAGFYAAEGTAYHEIAELCVMHGLDPADFVGLTMRADGHDIPITEDVPRWLERGLERIAQLSEGAELQCESRVDLSAVLGKGEGGRLDIGIINRTRRLIVVFDWKFGAGVPVQASWKDEAGAEHPNEQLALYGWGFAESAMRRADKLCGDEWTIRLIIEQPRAQGGGGEYDLSYFALEEEIERIGFEAAKTNDPNAPRIAGHVQCKFCKAKLASNGGCKAHSDLVLSLADLTDDDIAQAQEDDVYPPLPRVPELSLERLAYIHSCSDMLSHFLNDVQGYLLDRAKKGEKVPGMKMVRGRAGHRKYKEGVAEDAAAVLVEELGEKAYQPQEIISPAQAEKLLGKEKYSKIKQFVTQDQGGIALVSVHSRGEALRPTEDLLTDDDVI